MRGIDWFAGKGGYTSAMRAAGIEVVGACERDMAKRAAYVEACGVPGWFGEDVRERGMPAADVWTACANVVALCEWLLAHAFAQDVPWLVMETVTSDAALLEYVGGVRSEAVAGKRTFVVRGPRVVVIPPLPPHDGQGPESDPVALGIVLRAIVEAS